MRPLYRFKKGTIDAVVHHFHAPGAIASARQGGVLFADRNDAIGFGERPPLKALELAPLILNVPTLQRIALRFIVAAPYQGIDVMGRQYAASEPGPAQHVEE